MIPPSPYNNSSGSRGTKTMDVLFGGVAPQNSRFPLSLPVIYDQLEIAKLTPSIAII